MCRCLSLAGVCFTSGSKSLARLLLLQPMRARGLRLEVTLLDSASSASAERML